MSHPSERVAFSLFRILSFAALAAVFAAAPKPAFAQHGGGGGGGHSGGGGGGHSSGGSAGGHSAGGSHASGPASHAVAGGAHGAGGGAAVAGGAHGANVNAMTNHFAAPNRIAASREAFRATLRPAALPLLAQERVRRFGRPIFFFGNGCFNGFFPQFCGFSPFFGFGFGFGPGCWGSGWDSFGYPGFGNPAFGCGYGWGYDYTNYGYPYDASMSAQIEDNVEHPREYEPHNELVPYPSGGAEESPGGAALAPAEQPLMMLYLKDGSVYALSNYWVAGGQLHYVTQYGGENTVPLEQIDIQKTVDVNAHRGVTVTLKPAPQTGPAPAPEAPPQQP